MRHTSSATWYLQFVFCFFFGLCEIFNRWNSGNRMGLKYIPSRFDGLWMVVTWKPGYLEVSWMEAIHQGKSYSVKMSFNIRRKNNCIYAGNYFAALLQCLSCAGEPSAWPQYLGCQQCQAAASNPSPQPSGHPCLHLAGPFLQSCFLFQGLLHHHFPTAVHLLKTFSSQFFSWHYYVISNQFELLTFLLKKINVFLSWVNAHTSLRIHLHLDFLLP